MFLAKNINLVPGKSVEPHSQPQSTVVKRRGGRERQVGGLTTIPGGSKNKEANYTRGNGRKIPTQFCASCGSFPNTGKP